MNVRCFMNMVQFTYEIREENHGLKKRLSVAVLACLFAVTGCSEYENLTTQYSTETHNETSSTPVDAVKVGEGSQEVKEETKETVKTYKKGERGEFGDYSVKVIKSQSDVIEGGKSISVFMDVKNIGKEPISIDSSYFQLVDSDERIFDPADVFSISSDPIFLMDTINPGMSLSGKVVFEVPADVKSATIAMRDNMFDFGGAEYIFLEVGTFE